mgnify:CR=1 FL=1
MWTKYRGAAVLVTSPAKYGVDQVAAHWTSPMGVSFGFVKKRPIVVQDQVVARASFYLLLHFDRRVLHGSEGARVFHFIVEVLENPRKYLTQHSSSPNVETQEGRDPNR